MSGSAIRWAKWRCTTSLDRPELWRYVTDQRAAAASLDAVLSPDMRHVFGGPCAPANPVLPGFGHLIEAPACGCPLVIGPHTFNFAEAAELALAEGAAQRVADICEGVQAALELLRDPPALAQAQACGLAFAARHRGAMDRTLAALRGYL